LGSEAGAARALGSEAEVARALGSEDEGGARCRAATRGGTGIGGGDVPAGSRVGGSSSAVEAPGDDGDGGREGDSGDGDTQKILVA
jgi:hypothetical protein